MTSALHKVREAIAGHSLFSAGDHILVGVSGGADSVCLLYILNELASGLDVRLTAAHLDHGIRGQTAAADARFVQELAGAMTIGFVTAKSAVPRLAKRKGISLEMAAREARYAFFARAARQATAVGPSGKPCRCVAATAHTADDQAETFLLKLARGAGPGGLSGISREITINGLRIIRPMLEVTRGEVIAFLRKRGMSWREDETNKDLSFLRNRVRHEILPAFETGLNPRTRQALLKTADVLREEDIWLSELSDSILAECTSPAAVLSIAALKRHPRAARRRVIRAWLAAQGVPSGAIGFNIIDHTDRLLLGPGGSGRVDIGGYGLVQRSYDRLTVVAHTDACRDVEPFRSAIRIPGETLLTDNGLCIETVLRSGVIRPARGRVGRLPARASIDLRSAGRKKIFVRSWCAGDRMRPFGLNGSKKLQDIFVDGKVPVDQRCRVPVFECGGEIIWLPGYRIARGWEITSQTSQPLHITIKRI